jgi:Asp-tRNA(Asn)/Glu-tRNA(Gln) amidotransferase A subunit family amidase
MPFVVAFIGDARSDGALLGFAYDLEQATRARAAPVLGAR